MTEALELVIAGDFMGIHLSRDALQADRRGVPLGAPASCRLLTGADALKPAGTPAFPGSVTRWLFPEEPYCFRAGGQTRSFLDALQHLDILNCSYHRHQRHAGRTESDFQSKLDSFE